MRQSSRTAALFPVALLALAALLPGAGVVLAKEGLMVAFDAPIAMDTPPGTEVLVGMTVTALAEDGEYPVFGSPIVLVLTGRDGTETEAHGVEDSTGHYVARITVPAGGARQARVVMRGMSSDGPADIALMITTDPLTFGGVTTRTAQVAPAPTPALTPFPRATAAAPVVEPAAQVPAASAGPAPAWLLPGLAFAILGVAVAVAIRIRSSRRPAEGT